MSDFTTALKYLDYQKSRVATLDEASHTPLPFDKYYGLVKARDIKKIFSFITLPRTVFPYPSGGLHKLMGQFNVTLPGDFYILNANTTPVSENVMDCYVTVKWRVGTTVYRYVLSISNRAYAPWTNYVYGTPFYTNQRIGAECCFEIWRDSIFSPKFVGATEFGIQEEIALMTSFFRNPATPEELSVELDQADNFKTVDDIGFTMPAPMDIDQPTIIWNNN